ncbi:MAG: hypothetical protein ACOCUU_01885 [Nanoarchaeota archaeon]
MVNKKVPTDLEKALQEQSRNSGSENSQDNSGQQSNKQEQTDKNAQQMTKEQEISYHQGCLNTLVNERNELIKMAKTVEQIMQAHVQRLEQLGVKLQKK